MSIASLLRTGWALARKEISPREVATQALKSRMDRSSPLLSRLPDEIWNKHCLLLGSSGSGKSSFQEMMLKQWMDRSLVGGMSPIVIDGSVFPERVAHYLKVKGRLDDPKIILVDPSTDENGTLDHLPAIDLFALPSAMKGSAGADYLIGAYFDVCSAMMATALTDHMKTLFSYSVSLMFALPDETPSIHLLMDIVRKPGDYIDAAEGLDSTTDSFFRNEVLIDKSEYDRQRSCVMARFHGLMSRPAIRRLLFSKEPTLNLFKAIDSGAIVIVATRQADLGDDGACLVGQFMFNLVHRVIQARARSMGGNAVVRSVADEVHDYLVKGQEPHIAKILKQARKYGAGLMLATQDASVYSPEFWGVLSTCTAIKLVGRVGEDSAKRCAKMMGVKPDDLINLGDGEFYARVAGLHDKAIKIKIAPGALGLWKDKKHKHAMEAESRQAITVLRRHMARRYGMPKAVKKHATPEPVSTVVKMRRPETF